MTELSSQAQAVLDAYENSYTESGLVAALRAVADLVAPDDYKCFTGNLEWDAGMEACTDTIRESLLAIATELDGTNPSESD